MILGHRSCAFLTPGMQVVSEKRAAGAAMSCWQLGCCSMYSVLASLLFRDRLHATAAAAASEHLLLQAKHALLASMYGRGLQSAAIVTYESRLSGFAEQLL